MTARRSSFPGISDSAPRLKAAMAGLNADPARLLTQASIEAEHENSGRQAHDLTLHKPDVVISAVVEVLNASR